MTANERVAKLKKGLIPRDEAIKKFKVYDGCKEELIGGGVRVKFSLSEKDEDSVLVEHKKEEFTLGKETYTKLCRLVGIPSTYVDKTPSELFFPHLTYWLGEGGMTVKTLQKPVLDKDGRKKIVGFMREDSGYFPVNQILKVADKFGDNYLIENADGVSWRTSAFGIVFPKHEFEIKETAQRGDFIYGGIKIKYSILGEHPFRISVFLLTLVCMNGMVSANEIYVFNKRRAVGGENEFVEGSLQTGIGVLQQEVSRVQQLTSIPVTDEHIIPYVESLFDNAGVNQKSREEVLKQIVEKRPKNLYQLMNAATSAAHSVENRGDVYGLQSLGGYIVSHAASCPSCHRPL